jgi:FkbM family methyltransferase
VTVVGSLVRRFISGRRPDVETISSGIGAGLRIGRQYASADYRLGTNELPVQDALHELLHPGGVFFDVGSNVGFFALLGAREVGPQGSVHAFEPVPRIAEAIRRNAALNGFENVHVHEVAVSDREGTAELLLAQHPGGATLSPADAPEDIVGRTTVPVVALDQLVASGTVPVPDVVKIDVEGVEMEVLDGMAELLRTRRPALLCELDSAQPAVLTAKVATWRDRMRDVSYEVHDLAPSYEGSGWHVYHATARPVAGARSAPGQRSAT